MTERGENTTGRNFAFYIEVLLILMALLVIIVVLVSAFARARGDAISASHETREVVIARNVAEAFAATDDTEGFADLLGELDGFSDVSVSDGSVEAGCQGYDIDVDISSQTTSAGVLRTARISVVAPDKTSVDIETSRYVSGRGSGSTGSASGSTGSASDATGSASGAAGSASGAAGSASTAADSAPGSDTASTTLSAGSDAS